MSVDFVPFQDSFLAQAAELLAARHRWDRAVLPELPSRFEDAGVAWKAVEAVWHRPGASGSAAFDDGRLIGYLLGDLSTDNFRGRWTWVRLAGYALEEGIDAELYSDLYAAAGPQWLAHGCFNHYALVPLADEAVLAAWAGLGFARDQIYALRPLTDADARPSTPPEGVTIRRATPDDQAALVDLAPLISRHHSAAPAWVPIPPEGIAELQEGYAELVDDPTWLVWLALQEGEVLSFLAYTPSEGGDDDLLTPEACIELKVAGTREAARGRGIGQALTRHGLADAQANGYATCAVDWHGPNLLASRFWPKQGFRPVAYRLARRIDPRIAWADGRLG
jgi:ribosomal protein S18 acetylase RimI-like enzyme